MSDTHPGPRPPPSGISIIIVGAGFAGLTAAIEADRKGHTVTLLEKSSLIQPLGDIISFGQNSSRFFSKWPGVLEALDPIIHKSSEFHFHDWTGKFVTTQSFVAEHAAWGPRVNGHRGEIHQILFNYAQTSCPNLKIHLSQTVTEYFETPTHAGVTTSSGDIFTADLVLAAEGVRSKARSQILGFDDHSRPTPSGYAVFRAWFPSSPFNIEIVRSPSPAGCVEAADPAANSKILRDEKSL